MASSAILFLLRFLMITKSMLILQYLITSKWYADMSRHLWFIQYVIQGFLHVILLFVIADKLPTFSKTWFTGILLKRINCRTQAKHSSWLHIFPYDHQCHHLHHNLLPSSVSTCRLLGWALIIWFSPRSLRVSTCKLFILALFSALKYLSMRSTAPFQVFMFALFSDSSNYHGALQRHSYINQSTLFPTSISELHSRQLHHLYLTSIGEGMKN